MQRFKPQKWYHRERLCESFVWTKWRMPSLVPLVDDQARLCSAQASFFNSTGKGPYLRTETMALFCCCVKPVGIMNGPLIALLMVADAMTLPSRVIVRACPMLLAV